MVSEAQFDQITTQLYLSASGRQSWAPALEALRAAVGAKVVTLHGLHKTGQTVAFSFEVGDMPPQAALDFIRKYHQIEPKTALVIHESVGHVVSCHRHLNDAFVASDPYHQEFLIPYGLRYCTVIKAYEDDHSVVIAGLHRGVGQAPLDTAEEAFARRIGQHLQTALSMYFKLQRQASSAHIGLEVLTRLPYPILLIDEARRVVFNNNQAADLLMHSKIISSHHGQIFGSDAQSDGRLLIALRSLQLGRGAYLCQSPTRPSDRAFVRLGAHQGPWLGCHFHALRASNSMQAFGPDDLALVMLHTPEMLSDPDPFVVANMWDLSPAESQLMVAIGRGQTVAELADQRGVALSTVRSQLQAIMAKTRTARQAELVSLLTSMPQSLNSSATTHRQSLSSLQGKQ